MSQSPSRFDVSSVNGAQQCECWRHHSSSLDCVRSVQSIRPSTDVIKLILTLKMTTAQVVETSVNVNNNRLILDYVHPDDQTQPTFEFLNWVLKKEEEKVFFSKQSVIMHLNVGNFLWNEYCSKPFRYSSLCCIGVVFLGRIPLYWREE